MNYKSKRSKATDIPRSVKLKVWERDEGRCILCGSPYAYPNAHVIPRSAGGLGVEENIVTLCMSCHYKMDHTTERKKLLWVCESYLKKLYPEWEREKLIYGNRNL